jgi:DNA primase
VAISDEIKAQVDLVELIGTYVPELRKTGKNFSARCPFHQERTPSFVVFPDGQRWQCFGACSTGGDAFGFLMKIENLDFSGALKLLAQQTGVELPKRRSGMLAQNPIINVNIKALKYFQTALEADQGSLARSYLVKRKVQITEVQQFGLGYSPSINDDLMRTMEHEGISAQQLLLAGLVTQDERGQFRDMFRGRLMFAIRNATGEVVGFAGRALDDSSPKYINSPQTDLFDKGKLLYGLDLAKDSLANEGTAVIVEGYMDVIAAHKYGYRNVIASMGTALTESQVALLKERAKTIVLALDPDNAGQQATMRSLENSWNVFGRLGVGQKGATALFETPSVLDTLRIAVLPGGKDPDALINEDPMAWYKLIHAAVPVIDYLFDVLPHRDLSMGSQEKAALADRLFPLVAAVQNPFDQDRYFQRLADLLGVSRATLEAIIGRPDRSNVGKRRLRSRTERAIDPFRRVEGEPLEDYMLALILRYPLLAERIEEIPQAHFRGAESTEVLRQIRKAGIMGIDIVKPLEVLGEYVDYVENMTLPPANLRQQHLDFDGCLIRLEERYLREMKMREQSLLADQEGTIEPRDEEINSVNNQLKRIFTNPKGETSKGDHYGKENQTERSR